jgi:aryl-alcohol dehydrogenase-like predicted oxidoreductase
MEYRQLGSSGLLVPALSLGTATFGGGTEFFKAWGSTDVAGATRLVDICLDAGANLFDTANVYSRGLSEEILGKAIAGKRNRVLVSTKATFRMEDGANGLGSSRYHLIKACEDSLRRLNVETIDIYHMHGFDTVTPIEETLKTLDTLVQSGKVRYIACSNFSGWQLMKSLTISERYGWSRYVGHQGLLFAYRPRIRVGTHAARYRSKSECADLESARMGPSHRKNSAQPAASRREPSP